MPNAYRLAAANTVCKQTDIHTEQQANWDKDGCDPQTADVYPLTYPYLQYYYYLPSMMHIQVCWNKNALKWELQSTQYSMTVLVQKKKEK